MSPPPSAITHRTYARVGLLGNPSDGFHGKCISLSISNFWAEATISESMSNEITLTSHPTHDNLAFKDLNDLSKSLRRDGYTGGLALIQATCVTFFNYMKAHSKALSAAKAFSLKYDSNIPRQVGLAGSSAIITSALKCLLAFHEVTIEETLLPQLVLDVETKEMGITAGLQDRVVQVLQGLIYMDFGADIMAKRGHGDYERLPQVLLPKMYLAYVSEPSDSGRIHSDVKSRWKSQDSDVLNGMQKLASIAERGRQLLLEGGSSFEALGCLMNENFDVRRALYGDDVLGKDNLELIRIGRELASSPVKFSGSGGAVLGILIEESREDFVRDCFESRGFHFAVIEPLYC